MPEYQRGSRMPNGKYLDLSVVIPSDSNNWTPRQDAAWDAAVKALNELSIAMSAENPERSAVWREGYDAGLADGYTNAVRDAQVELRDALKDFQGAREVTISGVDTYDYCKGDHAGPCAEGCSSDDD